MDEERKNLILKYEMLPHYILNKHFMSVRPHTPFYEDLYQEGMLALCIGVNRLDPDKNATTYLYKFVWGSMMRYFNRQCPFTLASRTSYEKKYIMHPVSSLNITCSDPKNEHEIEVVYLLGDYENRYDEVDTYSVICKAFKKASSKYGTIILDMKKDGYSQREISKKLGLSKSHISRIIRKAYQIYKEEVGK